jgi:hypothetical protein
MTENEEPHLWVRHEVMPRQSRLTSYVRRWFGLDWLLPEYPVHCTFMRQKSFADWREVTDTQAFAITCLGYLMLMEALLRRAVPIHSATDIELEALANQQSGSERTTQAHGELRR